MSKMRFFVALLLWAGIVCGAEENGEPFLDAPRGLGKDLAEEMLSLRNELGNTTAATNNATNAAENATLSAKSDDSSPKNVSTPTAEEKTAELKANATEAAPKNSSVASVEESTAANATKAANSSNVLSKRDMLGGHHDCLEGPCIDAEPGYYSQECHAQKKCNDPKKFCHMYTCTDCLKENIVCTNNGQCCDGTICVYGRCAKGSKGSKVPGKFCDRQDDCASDACCVHEHQINPIIKICKPKLSKHQTCGPHNQFHQSDEHGAVDAACEPCKGKLQCKQVGLFGVHEICLDP